MIPATIYSSVRSGAERRLFRVIADAAGTEDWVCLHSLGLARHDTKRRGEIDFVLLTQHGVFTLEVKGGRVRREKGVWYCIDKYGIAYRKPESPFDQAAGAMFVLEKEVQREFKGSRIADALFGYGVVVPDVEFASLGCEDDPALVYDRRDRGKPFRAFLDRLAQFARQRDSRPRRGLSKSQIQELSEFLRKDFDLIPTFEVVNDDTRRELAELTREQRIVLDAVESQERIVVQGAAGSGKTLLAIETARRSARRGGNVLVLCYNRLLARQIDAAIRDENYRGSIKARTLHSQFRRMIERSSLRDEFRETSAHHPEGKVFSDLYPEYAGLAALEEVEPQYDCLVLDEAQDILNEKNAEVLDELIRGGFANGAWRFFLDSNNQACVFGQLQDQTLDRFLRNSVRHVLTVNCRNTVQIEFHTSVISNPQLRSKARVEGPPVEFVSYSPPVSPLDAFRNTLADLQKEDVSPGRISVLFPRIPSAEEILILERLQLRRLDETHVQSLGTDALEHVTWSGVSGFKGLENDVVILVGVEDIEKDWWRAITYVGMSRARTRLYVIISTQCESARKVRLERELEERLSNTEMYA